MITIAIITKTAPGVWGKLGLTTTTTVALPVSGIIGASALVGYGVYKGVEMASQKSKKEQNA